MAGGAPVPANVPHEYETDVPPVTLELAGQMRAVMLAQGASPDLIDARLAFLGGQDDEWP